MMEEKGVQPEIVQYLDTPPTEDELRDILKLLGIGPRDLMRRKEAEYKAQGLDDENLSDDDLIKAMIATPKLIERPIVIANGKAALGRPPEKVLDIL